MKAISLTGGFVTVVDDDVYAWATLRRWRAISSKGKTYAASGASLLHREILAALPGQLVDHRDGNGLWNVRSNLRIATHSQNAANRPGIGASGLKGVRWDNARGWLAQVVKDGRRHILGPFPSAETAAAAYNAKAVEIHGEFARLNEDPRLELPISIRGNKRFTLFKRGTNGRRLAPTSPGYFRRPFYVCFTINHQRRIVCLRTADSATAQKLANAVYRRALVELRLNQQPLMPELHQYAREATLDATWGLSATVLKGSLTSSATPTQDTHRKSADQRQRAESAGKEVVPREGLEPSTN